MMYAGTSWSSILWLCLHGIFMLSALFGFLAALLWLFKHASKKDFLTVVWVTLGIGILGTLLTASVAMNAMSGMHGAWSGWDFENSEDTDVNEFMNDMMNGAILE